MTDIKLKVLLIEDDLIDQMAFKRALKRTDQNYDFWIAESIAEARQILEQVEFDVVISDFALGDGNLFEIQDVIVKKGIPIIITTGAGDEEIAVKAIKNGADDYIIKDIEGNYLKILPTTIAKAIEIKKADELIRKLSRALEQSPGSIMIIDINRHIEYVNQKFTDLTGYSFDEVLGKDPSVLMADELSLQLFEKAWINIREGREWKGELCNKKKNGENYWEMNSISVIRNKEGVVTNYIRIGEDITARKKAERALEHARETAEAANRAKSEFLANMSHEIRTPLTGIIGMAELLQETLLDDFQTEYANTIMDSARDLLNVITDILDFSKIEARSIDVDYTDFELRPVLHSLTRILSPQAIRKKLLFKTIIDPNIPAGLNGDPLRLRQILSNLINNAIKFTEQGKVTVQVNLEHSDQYEVSIKFMVSDTGIGVAPVDQIRLFRPFVQVDSSSTRRFGGTGLGLAICKRLVEAMHGTIGVESSPGKGSRFWFTLPFGFDSCTETREEDKLKTDYEVRGEQTQLSFAEENSQEIISPSNLLILLVEDDPVARKVARFQLNKLGYQVHIAINGQEAVNAAISNQYALVLMDCHLPVMDGFQATQAIREAELHQERHVPIIAMTARAMAEDKDLCLAAGMDDYISKPVELQKLNAIVKKWAF